MVEKTIPPNFRPEKLSDEVVLVFDLNGGLAKVILRSIKRRKELAVEILPVGDDEHRGVLEFRTSGNQTRKERHGEALS